MFRAAASHGEMMSQVISFPGRAAQLNHLHVVGRVKPLPPVVLNPPTPALIVLVLDLPKLLTCREKETFLLDILYNTALNQLRTVY